MTLQIAVIEESEELKILFTGEAGEEKLIEAPAGLSEEDPGVYPACEREGNSPEGAITSVYTITEGGNMKILSFEVE